jgi:site-specific recombinase XerD
MHMTVADIDAYLQSRVSSLRRASRKGIALGLRSFVRYLYETGRTGHDLSRFVIVPRMYAYESIPSALRPADISAVLSSTRQDRSPIGLRDYAILMMLSTYGAIVESGVCGVGKQEKAVAIEGECCFPR